MSEQRHHAAGEQRHSYPSAKSPAEGAERKPTHTEQSPLDVGSRVHKFRPFRRLPFGIILLFKSRITTMNPKCRFVALWFACLVVVTAPKLHAQDPLQHKDEARPRSTKPEFDPSDLDQTSRWLWSRIATLHEKGKRAAEALQENGLNDDLMKEYERDVKAFDEQINQNGGKIVVWKMKVEMITTGDVHLRPIQSAAPFGALVVQLDEEKAFRKVQDNGLITSHRPGDAIPLFPRSKCTGGALYKSSHRSWCDQELCQDLETRRGGKGSGDIL